MTRNVGSGAAPPDLAALRAELEGVALRGLADAADALLGDAPERICAVLGSWARIENPRLPVLTDSYARALEPVGVGGDDPVQTGLHDLLAGAWMEPAAARQLIGRSRRRAGEPARAGLPAGREELVGELWRRALLDAATDYWRVVGDYAAQLHLAIGAGDPGTATDAGRVFRPRLRGAADRLALLASQFTGQPPAPTPTPAPATTTAVAAATQPDAPAYAARPPARRRSATATRRPPTAPAWQPPARRRRARDRRIAPVLFLVVAICAAAGWLYKLVYGWPPPLPPLPPL